MPSFDIVSRVDFQLLDNALQTTRKELNNRYDSKGVHAEIDWDRKSGQISLEVGSEMQLGQLQDVLLTKAMRQGLEANSFDLRREPKASGKNWKKTLILNNGIDREMAKKIVKLIKDTGLKVQAAIMDDTIRVSAKKIDDLQKVIQTCRASVTEIPLQFVNQKS